MAIRLEGLRWRPSWVSHQGCLLGCLEYLGSDISPGWLYGGDGHAFALNLHPELCPSGPTAWRHEVVSKLARNVGVAIWELAAEHQAPEGPARQRMLWGFVRGCLDLGIPCLGWALDVPEWYVVFGYDEVGYYYSGAGHADGGGPVPWDQVPWGWTHLAAVLPCAALPDEEIVRAALRFALDSAGGAHAFPEFHTGPAAFVAWAAALENGTASRHGHLYNALCWGECRARAVEFLTAARAKLDGLADEAFDAAIREYRATAEALGRAGASEPFRPDFEERLKSPEQAALVRSAAGSEQRALEAVTAALASFG